MHAMCTRVCADVCGVRAPVAFRQGDDEDSLSLLLVVMCLTCCDPHGEWGPSVGFEEKVSLIHQ